MGALCAAHSPLSSFRGVRVFGEAEFWLSSFKILTLVGLMLFGLIIDLGGNPTREVIGFRHWDDPGPMGTWWDRIIGNTDLARFVGFGSVLGKYSSSHVLHFTGQ